MSALDQPFQDISSCFSFRIAPSSSSVTNGFQRNALTVAEQQQQKEIDALLTDALNGLTFDERQEQQEVLHGVEAENSEDITFLNNALAALDANLAPKTRGTAFEIAEKQNPSYVNARSFRITFLRGNRYDINATADQMIRFFTMKQKLFGTEKLTKDITIMDLDENDIHSLQSGSIQIAGKDRSNRQILFQALGLRSFKTLRNEMRMRYYVTMSMLQSEETQLKGIVAIAYTVGKYQDSVNGMGFLEHMKLSLALPVYTASFHACCDDIREHLLGSLALSIMPPKLKARFRLHLGSHLESQYQLSTYGIPAKALPLMPWTNEINLNQHLEWCRSRLQEVTGESPSFAQSLFVGIVPNDNDVLYMGGKKSVNRGNDRLRTHVKELAHTYVTGSMERKRLIVDDMITEIRNTGGRFLKQTKTGMWNEVPLDEIRAKLTQMFRNYKRRQESSRKTAPDGVPIREKPRLEDVIFGRFQRSGGNDLLHKLIKERSEEYDALDRGTKQPVVDAVILAIHQEGGRFLQPVSQGWLELTNDMAREKVSRYFRNYRRPSKKQKD